jgi:dTDP-4-amino-4,6-dideoxygalactose transaminase
MSARPAILGGEPAFAHDIPFVRPALPVLDDVAARLRPSWESGMITNGALVRELEEALAARLGVAHVVAVASCTTGLMLVFRALDVSGPVLMPSFTFSASAHAVAWAGAEPVFAECDPERFQLDVSDAGSRVRGADALVATHVFGAPCRPGAVEDVARAAGIPVVFDAAHALGAQHADRPIGGFGLAEVFSLTPTKPLVAGEGGIVATDDAALADAIRIGRDYGNPGDYDTRFVGLNGRMSELHAAVALESLRSFDEMLAVRREIAASYTAALSSVNGIAPQVVDRGDASTFKDFTVRVDPSAIDRDALVAALRAEGVDTRCYFDPPVHRQAAYRARRSGTASLPVTDRVAASVVSLPIYPGLGGDGAHRVVDALERILAVADEVVELMNRNGRTGATGDSATASCHDA